MVRHSPRRWLLALLLGSLLASPTVAFSQAPSPLSVLSQEVLALFPKVDTDVIEVRGGEVTISLGKRDGLQPGIELSLYRPGRELKHPRTGEVLGRTEEPLGRMRITQVLEAYAIGTLGPGGGVVPGDRARLSAGRIPVMLVTLLDRTAGRTVAEAASHEVFEALNKTERFRATWGDQVVPWMAQEKITPDEFLRGRRVAEAAERFKFEYLLALHFKTIEKRPFVEVRLFSPTLGDPLLTTAFFVPSSVGRPSDKSGFSGGGDPKPNQVVRQRSLLTRLLTGESEPLTYSSGETAIPLKELARFPFVVTAFDMAVAPVDGIARMVVTDGSKIYQYRVREDKLEPEWTYSVRPFGNILNLQLADLDGDGVFEVVVNRHQFSASNSLGMVGFILGVKADRPQIIVDDVDMIMLAVDETGGGVKRTLWVQPYHREHLFTAGRVNRAELKNGKLVLRDSPRVPSDFRAMGAIFSNIGGKTGPRTLAYIDVYRRLRISAEGEELWRSSTGVGGGGPKVEVKIPYSATGKSNFFQIEPMPLALDLDNDGIDEIIVPQNVTQDGLIAVVFRGPVGYRIQSVNSGFEGPIVGIGAIPGERPTLLAAVVRQTGGLLGTGLLSRSGGETQIIVTVSTE